MGVLGFKCMTPSEFLPRPQMLRQGRNDGVRPFPGDLDNPH